MVTLLNALGQKGPRDESRRCLAEYLDTAQADGALVAPEDQRESKCLEESAYFGKIELSGDGISNQRTR